MRRLLVIPLVATAIVIAGGVSASSARTPAKSPAIVCPLRTAALPAIVPCCGPIVAPSAGPSTGTTGVTGVTTPICCPCCLEGANVGTFCCPPTAICARPLSISSSPNPSSGGAAITVSGTILSSSQPSVTLWQELSGQTKYEQLATTDAATDGTYSFTLKAGTVTTNRDWYISNGSQQSAVDDQLVQASVTAADAAPRNGRVVISGQVQPSHAGEQVLVERKAGSQWTVVGRGRLTRRSTYRVRVAAGRAGRVSLRIHLPADARNTDSFSRTMSFTVV